MCGRTLSTARARRQQRPRPRPARPGTSHAAAHLAVDLHGELDLSAPRGLGSAVGQAAYPSSADAQAHPQLAGDVRREGWIRTTAVPQAKRSAGRRPLASLWIAFTSS